MNYCDAPLGILFCKWRTRNSTMMTIDHHVTCDVDLHTTDLRATVTGFTLFMKNYIP